VLRLLISEGLKPEGRVSYLADAARDVVLALFPCCPGYDVRRTLLGVRIKERIIQIVRARRCGIMKVLT
jgi:hypothetical protein